MKKLLICILISLHQFAFAQTDIDALMMNKKQYCGGFTYNTSSWKNYWEGTFNRDNQNLGKVSVNSVMAMGTYGITNRINVVFSLPYVKTNASQGTLKGQKGLQDLLLAIKWMTYKQRIKNVTVKCFLVTGFSIPTTNYSIDLMPLTIGVKSKAGILRAMVDIEKNKWFATAAGTYVLRSNVKLDKNNYYTTEMHYSNEVYMPNATNLQLRTGYRSSVWIIEAIANKFITNGGFDISKNNMPFVSNKINATSIAVNIKYQTQFLKSLYLILNGFTTVAGRNVGQAKGMSTGAVYVIQL